MNTLNKLILIAALAAAGAAQAQEKGCIELRTEAQTEETVVGPDGKPQVQFVAASKVVPGTQVFWTITAKNVCEKPAGDVAIDSPVPEHMLFISDRTIASGLRVTYSIDGKQFASADALTVREADGTTRAAKPADFRYVRYAMATPLAPGATVAARYSTVVE
jgi:uncharacterized repeat protein (TIGR01451 family)